MKYLKLYENIDVKIISNDGNIELMDNGNKIGQITMSKTNDECKLIGINVFPKYQGKGYFKKLMDLSIEWCKLNNLDKITLEVYKSNEKVINLYKKYGYYIINEPSKLGDGFVKMMKIL